ncbi:hypothetical protein F5B19DRAFT_463338 [Rostrohypoxylon terebratum]|nr:hypothetical protein F5B19DRAFT_463338 [Rostrohypoxylon terebratum]
MSSVFGACVTWMRLVFLYHCTSYTYYTLYKVLLRTCSLDKTARYQKAWVPGSIHGSSMDVQASISTGDREVG